MLFIILDKLIIPNTLRDNENDKTVKDMDDLVNDFYNSLLVLDQCWQKKIPNHVTSEENSELSERNPSSIFLTAVEECEIVEILYKFKNKSPTDYILTRQQLK